MNNMPYGSDLLAVARRTLLDELLPLLPADKTYDVLMIANAMAIAARELQPHCGHDEPSRQLIARFYEQASVPTSVAATEQGLAGLIRERALPAARQQDLHALLLSLTRAKLALSNPKYLQAFSRETHEQ